MLRGDWRKLSKAWRLALALMFAAAIAGTWVGWGLWQQAEYEWKAQHQSAEQASYARDYIRDRCLSLARLDKIDCATKARDEHRVYQRDEQDLVAQKTSALWTMIMGWAATFGMVLSAVGVYLVWTTFAETRRSNEIASDTAKRQLRAYVAVESATITITGHSIKVVANVRNFGETPAHSVSLSLDLHMIVAGIFRRKPIQEEAKGLTCNMSIGVLPPNCSIPTDMIGWNNAIIGLPELPLYMEEPLGIVTLIIVTNGQLCWETVFKESSALGVSIIYENYQYGLRDLATRSATGIVRHTAT